MSGSGFYRYRCKYFYSHNCPNWVYCQGHACAVCLAEGRDATDSKLATSSQAHLSANWRQQNRSTPTEICVPQAIDGTLRYTVMEIIPTEQSGPGTYWVLRQKAMAPQALPYTGITTSDTPRAVMAPVGIPLQMAY